MDLSKISGTGNVNIHLGFVEQWLTCPKDQYIPPPIPVTLPDFSDLSIEEFGHGCKKLYHLTDEFVFLNHGALGCTLNSSLQVAQDYQRYMDSQPLRAIDRELLPLLCHVTRVTSDYVGCDAQDLILIENATTGINIILRSLKLTPADTILTLSLGYGAVKLAVDMVCGLSGAKHEIIDIPAHVKSKEEIIHRVSSSLHDSIKLAIFDHLPSNAAYLLPIKELNQICKQKGIMVLIDGAHSLGQVDLDIRSLDTDFFVTNCHKWFCNTRGSALMYVRRELQEQIHPLVASWGQGKSFAAEFIWSGTQYYSQYISLLSTINFWNRVGAARIRDYCNSTIIKAERLCREAWKVEPVCPPDMLASMALVRLPDKLNDESWKTKEKKYILIQDYLYFKKNIEATTRVVDGAIYIRLSCHIYNDLSDFQKLSDAVLEVCDMRDQLE